MVATGPVRVGGPHFEDFEVGQVFDDAPAMTLTSGHAALHQALVGDRLRMPLDATLSTAVTMREATLAHPNLVCDVAIGQTTGPTQRVKGNLFYRGLVLLRPVYIGDTLRTRTEVVGLRQNRPRPDGSATGLVALRMQTTNQAGEPVLDFYRCPMIPLRDTTLQTGRADDFGFIPAELDPDQVRAAVPRDWRYDAMRECVGEHFADVVAGQVYEVEGRDTITCAVEMVRLTLNVAEAHSDGSSSAHGRRLVYGGLTISMTAAQITRALPNLMTVVAWRECQHTGPVFEGDILQTTLTLEATHQLDDVRAGLVDIHAIVHAEREGAEEPPQVLDWRLVGLMA